MKEMTVSDLEMDVDGYEADCEEDEESEGNSFLNYI